MQEHENTATSAFTETLPQPGSVSDTNAPPEIESALARARIRNALFPTSTPKPTIGRFQVLDRLGAGGMGVVYMAHDPELDRRVAIKVLREQSGGLEAASRLQREAQAIARVSHPNVVAVHETGVHDGAVYVVMEYVRGQPLRDWLRAAPRQPAAIIDMFIEAGNGLVAAHAAGLIHRDFKPENVIVGEDERPRVLDFGLARSFHDEQAITQPSATTGALSELTRTGAVMGTPSYMSPEQFRGVALTPATDQFSFCVGLFEALFGERPYPGDTLDALLRAVTLGDAREPPRAAGVSSRVRAALRRGLARDPARRFPSMDALLRELAPRSPRRAPVWLMAGALTVPLGGALWLGLAGDDEPDPCSGAALQLREVWDEDVRAGLRQRLVGDAGEWTTPARVWQQLASELDSYTASWRAAYTEACEATVVRREQSAEIQARRMRCLDRRRRDLAALTEGLAGGHAKTHDRALRLVATLKPTARCLDHDYLLDQTDVPEDPEVAARVERLQRELAELRALEYTGEQDKAATLAAAALVKAESLGYQPLEAEAALLLGRMQSKLGEYERATETLERAHFTARESGSREVASDSAAELIYATGIGLAKGDVARVWAKAGEAELNRLGRGGPEERVLLTIRGNTWARLGELEAARADLERALEITRETYGEHDVRTALALNNLGGPVAMSGELDRAGELFAESLAAWRASVGDGHPEAALAIGNLANVHDLQGRPDEARPLYERQLEILQETRGEQHPHTAAALHNLATLLVSAGERELADSHLRRALAAEETIFGPDHPELVETLNALADNAHNLGELEAAREHADRALRLVNGSERTGSLRETAAAHMLRGVITRKQGQAKAALPDLERAVELFTEHGEAAVLLHRSRRELGFALQGAGREGEARAAVLRSRDGFAALGQDYAEQVAELDAWLAKTEG